MPDTYAYGICWGRCGFPGDAEIIPGGFVWLNGELGGCSSIILCTVSREEHKNDEGRILSKHIITSLIGGLMLSHDM